MQRACRSPDRLYLPREWASEMPPGAVRRRSQTISSQDDQVCQQDADRTGQIEAACAAGIARGVVSHGPMATAAALPLCTGVSGLGRSYVASIEPTDLGAGAEREAVAAEGLVRGRRKTVEATAPRRAASVAGSVKATRRSACRTRLAKPSAGERAHPIGCVRVSARARGYVPRAAIDRTGRALPEEWLLIERPPGESEPTNHRSSSDCLLTLSDSNVLASTSPVNYAGGSSAIIRQLSKKSASGTTRDADGAASTITPHCASPPTGFLRISHLREGDDSPLEDLRRRVPIATSRSRWLHTERLRHCGLNAYSPNSIATMRRRLIVALSLNGAGLPTLCSYSHVRRRCTTGADAVGH